MYPEIDHLIQVGDELFLPDYKAQAELKARSLGVKPKIIKRRKTEKDGSK